MYCLIDYIGIKSCGFAPSKSGMYLQDLPGMEFEQLEKISSPEQGGYTQVWKDIQNRASRRFNRDVISAFSDRYAEAYRIKQIAQSVNMGKWINPTIGNPVNLTNNSYPNWYGHSIELNNPDDTCVCSNMQNIYIQEINFYWQGAVGPSDSVNIAVIDADFGITLWESTITQSSGLVAKWNNVNVETDFFGSRRVFVVMNGTMTQFVDQEIGDFNLTGFMGDFGCASCGTPTRNNYGWWFGWGTCGCTSQVQGVVWNGSTATFGTNIYGMSAVFRVNCSYSGLVCQNKKHFADAWLHCLAMETLDQRIYSNRLNSWTTINANRAKELRQQIELQYKGGKQFTGDNPWEFILYTGSLEKAVKNVYLDTSDCCIAADSTYQQQESVF